MAALPPRAAVYTRWRSRAPPASVALISNVLPSLGRMILRRLRDHLEAKAQPPQDWPTPSPIHRSFPGLLHPSLSKAAPASYQARSSVGALYHRALDSTDRGAIILALRKFRVVPVAYSLGHGSLTRSSRLCSLPLKGERRWPGVHAESRKHQPGAVLVSAVGPLSLELGTIAGLCPAFGSDILALLTPSVDMDVMRVTLQSALGAGWCAGHWNTS